MKRFIFIPLLLLTMAPACSDSDLATLATNLNRAATAVDTVQGTVIAAHESDLISKADADSIVTITVKVARAIGLANSLTREFTNMPEDGRDQLVEILVPVMDTLEEGLMDENLGIITDAGLKSAIELGFRTALLGLQTAKTLLEVSN